MIKSKLIWLRHFPQHLRERIDQAVKHLIILYFSLSIIRFLVALLFPEPLIMPDELSYKAMAWGYFVKHDFFFLNSYSIGPSLQSIPNVLYQFIISPCFYYHENFYIAAKLINSFVIHLTIFPIYFIARDFIPRNHALFCTFMVSLLPFFNYNILFLTENLFFPLFWLCFFFAYKAFSSLKLHYFILSGVFLFLLFLTKPQAIAFFLGFILAVFATIILYLTQHRPKKMILNLIFLVSLTTALSIGGLSVWDLTHKEKSPSQFTMISNITGSIFTSLAGPKDIEQNTPEIQLSNEEKNELLQLDKKAGLFNHLLKLGMAHTGALLFIYLFPIMASIGAFFCKSRKRENKDFIFNILGLAVFLSMFFMTLLWAVSMSQKENFSRLHERWYAPALPFFLLAFFIFSDRIKLSKTLKSILIVGLLLMTVLICLSYSPYYIKMKYTFFIDHPSLNLVTQASLLFWIFLLILLGGMTIRVLIKGRLSLPLFLLFFIFYAGAANYYHIKSLTRHHNFRESRLHTKFFKPFIRSHIHGKKNKVALFGSDQIFLDYTAFTYSYYYTRSKILSPHSEITENMIPENTDYIILFDEYDIKFPTIKDFHEGIMRIIALPRENNPLITPWMPLNTNRSIKYFYK